MFNFFRKKSEKDKLTELYQKLLQDSFELSKSNRALSDQKYAEAQLVLEKIEGLLKNNSDS